LLARPVECCCMITRRNSAACTACPRRQTTWQTDRPLPCSLMTVTLMSLYCVRTSSNRPLHSEINDDSFSCLFYYFVFLSHMSANRSIYWSHSVSPASTAFCSTQMGYQRSVYQNRASSVCLTLSTPLASNGYTSKCSGP